MQNDLVMHRKRVIRARYAMDLGVVMRLKIDA
jgi:hypothetical protein